MSSPEALQFWHQVQALESYEVDLSEFHETSAEVMDSLIRTKNAADHLLHLIMEMSTHAHPQVQLVADSPFLASMVTGALRELGDALGYEPFVRKP